MKPPNQNAVRFNVHIETEPARRPSSFDVENSILSLTNMGPDEYQVYVTGENGFYKVIVVSYPTMLPSADDIQRVLQTEAAEGPYTVTVDKVS